MNSLLLVDDDQDLVDLLAFALGRAGFRVIPAHDAPTAAKLLDKERPDLIVLDVNLGAWSGFDLLRDIRSRHSLPVILLTARGAEEDKVRGLELGADDYVTKPFSHKELIARIRANLRRQEGDWTPAPAEQATLRVGPVVLNSAEHRATCDDRQVELTVTEFRFLHYLMLNPGVAVPTRAILRHVWGYDDPGAGDVVRVTLHRLRRKLGDDPAHPRLLHTVPGVGIMLKAE